MCSKGEDIGMMIAWRSWTTVLVILIGFSTPNVSAYGSLWPQPMNITQTGRVLHYCRRHFTWKAPRKTSTLLQKAFDRYSKIIFEQSMPLHGDEDYNVHESKDISANTHAQREFVSEIMRKHNAIKAVEVYVDSSDQSLGLDISETYTIRYVLKLLSEISLSYHAKSIQKNGKCHDGTMILARHTFYIHIHCASKNVSFCTCEHSKNSHNAIR